MLKYLRLNLFYKFLRPYQQQTRRKRSEMFSKHIRLQPGMKVLDLGGTPEIWQFVETPLDITLLNLEFDPQFTASNYKGHHNLTFIQGDACDTKFPSNAFDLVFSNSVIEHVGDVQKQQAFAAQVHRLAPRYWVQTPAKWFPIEAHTGMPFWWFLPERLRTKLIANWRKDLPLWSEYIAGTRLVDRASLTRMFPNSSLLTERNVGLVKSYIVCRA